MDGVMKVRNPDMKYFVLAFCLFFVLLLAACSAPQMTSGPVSPPNATPTANAISTQIASDEVEVRQLVENFGRQLQAVSLLAPDAAQEIQARYSSFVSPALLAGWMADPSKAPGRMVSSPWPDHIEITAAIGEEPGTFVINGLIIEVTSIELANGGAAARLPVQLVVQKIQGRWVITEYSQESYQ